MKRRIALSILAVLLCGGAALGAETDQYYAWGQPLTDSTDAVNARFNLELERSIASFPEGKPDACRRVAVEFRRRMRSILFHEIQVWSWNSKWVTRVPDGTGAQREYRQKNLYSKHPIIDPGTWMPYTPTIEVAGVRFGVDKISHIVSSGWTYFTVYEKAIKNGLPPEAAERKAVQRGVIEENLQLGGMTAGVRSSADVNASFGGMQMYIDLCDGDEPVLEFRDGAWVVARPIDLGDYITPLWDESYNVPMYNKGRWKRVRPVLETYCHLLSDPAWVEHQRSYAERDDGSLVMDFVQEQVDEGKVEDPAQFRLEAVCPEPDPGASTVAPAVTFDPPPVEAVSAEVWKQRIDDEEHDRRRFAFGLFGVQLTYPQVVTASLAVMATSQPKGWSCENPCIYRGPFFQIRPGLGGGSASVGYGRITGIAAANGSILKNPFIGLLYKLTVLRSWGGYSNIEPGQTFVGPEIVLPVGRANLAFGVLRRIGDDAPGKDWRVTGSIGWGF